MLQALGAGSPAESYEGEYLAYLRDFIDDKIVFTKERQAEAAAIQDVLALVNFALQRELDSITFYQEAKMAVPENRHNVIDRIIAEERQHVVQLASFKRDYVKQVDG
jgi:rubrerythrin